MIYLGANDGKSIDPVYPLHAAGAAGILEECNADIYPLLVANVQSSFSKV